MKNMRDHLFSLGALAVLTLSVALAQDQAPQMPPAAPAAAPANTGAPVAAPAAQRAPAVMAPRTIPKGIPAYDPNRRTSTSTLRRSTPAPAATPNQGLPPVSVAPAMPSMTPPSSMSSPSYPSAGGDTRSKTTTPSLKFDSAPSDIILQAYAQETGKTLLPSPDVPKANITLKSQPDVLLSKEEYLEAIEVVLSMHGIALEPFGDKFVKVLARKTLRTDGIKILMEKPEGGHPEKSQTVSQMIQLKSITIAEAQKALEGFKKPDGLIQTFERTNSLLVTDTQENVNRMLEIVRFIDQPLVATEEVNVIVIRFAKADDIKKRLEELVQESQKQTQAKEEIKSNAAGSPGFTRSTSPTTTRPMPPGLSRLGTQQPAAVTPNEILETLVSDADRGMIRGKVQIISDERSNQLIIITRKENLTFFERIISVLDIETTPDVTVNVQRLEFADAEEVSTMLNDLIGNASAKKDDKAPTKTKGTPSTPDQPAKSTTLAEAVAARTAGRAEGAAVESDGKSKLGQLSKDNIKILADKRTNAIVMMGSSGDLAAIKEIIMSMDIQLSQVLIETVVLEVGLKDSLETGVNWVRRVELGGNKPIYAPKLDADGNQETDPDTGLPVYTDTIIGYTPQADYRYGAGGGGGGTPQPKNLFSLTDLASDLTSNALGVVTSGSAGLEYMATFKNLNLDAVVTAAKTDDDAKVLSSPVLLTVDNKEATIEATELQYLYKGMRYMGYSSSTSGAGSYEPDIEQRDVGLVVKVTPRISPNGNVVLTIDEKFEDVLGSQTIQGQSWPTITTRKITADVSVGSGETVILGGLVKTAKAHGESGIPILKDIPYIGKYLFGSVVDKETRSELLVFLTPYVINTPEEMDRETRRRRDYVNAADVWTKGWSDSKLADETIVQKIKREKAERAAARAQEAGRQAPTVREAGVMSASVVTNVFVGDTHAAPAGAATGAGGR